MAIRRGLLERMRLFPKRLEENPPREGFFEHDEYLKVRAQAPASYQDVLGRCEYRWVCGGSRARAFSTSGDPLAEDPLCVYDPAPPD